LSTYKEFPHEEIIGADWSFFKFFGELPINIVEEVPMKDGRKDSDILQLVTFKLENEEFGVDILKVQEIMRTVEITRIPNAPEFVEGVINLRGKIIPIVDLRKRLGFRSKEWDPRTRIIVVELDGLTIGFVVDSVSEVLRIPRDTIEPPPSIVSGIESDYIEGVGKTGERLLLLLELGNVLKEKEKRAARNIEVAADG
jgi:purine-binding chemotaxis protein CheW